MRRCALRASSRFPMCTRGLTVPPGAVIGAAGGTACAAACQSHPNAEAEFEKILKAANAGNPSGPGANRTRRPDGGTGAR